MRLNVSKVVPEKSFNIIGMSYIGAPRSNTAMFITKKVEHLLSALELVDGCLVFAETGIEVSEGLTEKHAFHFSEKPQLSYARFAKEFADERFKEEKKLKFNIMSGGYYVSEDVDIPDDAYIEPGCVIGPDVQFGKNARILAGSIIKHTSIGDNFLSNEYAVIGANGFTMAEDEEGNKFRIPTLGRVVIGNNVEVGAHDNISCGSGGDTVIEDFVKLDALVHLGHDVRLQENVEITAGGIIGGFDNLGVHSYVGINAVLRNRINVGEYAIIGMGSTVTKSVEANVTVVGNPARLFVKGN
jgi:UDP-3-O-[3-hydroxymyristoyl] glucosamine N-acyltransferase